MAKKKTGGVDPMEAAQELTDMLFMSLSMILLAFFILLYNLANLDARRVRISYGSLAGTFGLAPAGANVGSDGDVYKRSKLDMVEATESATYRPLKDLIKQAGLTPFVELVEDEEHPVLRFEEPLLFPAGGQALSPAAFPLLDRLAQVIVMMKRPVRIEGHTDPMPSKGDLGNWGLSVARANEVMRFLTEAARPQVPEKLVTAVGRGAAEPLGSSDNPEARERSRRVEIYFL